MNVLFLEFVCALEDQIIRARPNRQFTKPASYFLLSVPGTRLLLWLVWCFRLLFMSFWRSYVLGLAISRSLLLGLIIEGITVISFSRKMGVLDPLSSYLIPILPYSKA